MSTPISDVADSLDVARALRHAARRREIVRIAEWGIAHAAQIHYAEVRPIPVHVKPFTLPLTTDCSGWVTLCYAWSGAPDPNGLGYSGAGFTGTLLQHGALIPVNDARGGDVVVYGGGSGHHAALVIDVARVPQGVAGILTSSHGEEDGPLRITVAEEMKYQPAGLRFLRFPMGS